jgi:hypothetical protein
MCLLVAVEMRRRFSKVGTISFSESRKTCHLMIQSKSENVGICWHFQFEPFVLIVEFMLDNR